MDAYAVKLTIVGMRGVFAEKYSATIENAQFLNQLFLEIGARAAAGPIPLLRASEEAQHFDPLPMLPRLMKVLRAAAKDYAEQRFFTGVRLEPDNGDAGPWERSLTVENGEESITVDAFGRRATLRRGEEEEDLSGLEDALVSTSAGSCRLRFESWKTLFKEDLVSLITMCEEAMAKGEDLICTTLPR